MPLQKFLNKVGIRLGTLINKDTGDSFADLNDALKTEADCGCGIDCCNSELKLRDQTTQETIAFYVSNHVPYIRLADGTVLEIETSEVE